MSGTTDMTSWDLGQQEEDLENSKFRKRAFHESSYPVRSVKIDPEGPKRTKKNVGGNKVSVVV